VVVRLREKEARAVVAGEAVRRTDGNFFAMAD
jgi:hypothetical protein